MESADYKCTSSFIFLAFFDDGFLFFNASVTTLKVNQSSKHSLLAQQINMMNNSLILKLLLW